MSSTDLTEEALLDAMVKAKLASDALVAKIRMEARAMSERMSKPRAKKGTAIYDGNRNADKRRAYMRTYMANRRAAIKAANLRKDD